MRRPLLVLVAVVAYITCSVVFGSCWAISHAIRDMPAQRR